MNNYEILPYVGVGLLKFGMSQLEAERVLGKPSLSQYDEDAGLVTDYWNDNGLQLFFERGADRLVLISLYSNIDNIGIGSVCIDWDKTKEVYKALLSDDFSAKQTVGITIFFKYGLSVAGFLSENNGDKSLTVFAKGQWDPDDPLLRPVKIGS